MSVNREQQLEALFPAIEWRKPVKVQRIDIPDRHWYACRLCIALYGLRGEDAERLFMTEAGCSSHIATFHPVEAT